MSQKLAKQDALRQALKHQQAAISLLLQADRDEGCSEGPDHRGPLQDTFLKIHLKRRFRLCQHRFLRLRPHFKALAKIYIRVLNQY